MSTRSGPIRATSYTSNDIPIPDSFLSSPPSPLPTLSSVLFGPTLPEYAPHTAFLVRDVLTPAECEELLRLAERSSPASWEPALVSVGPGLEAAIPSYRHSDRIIWDRQDVVDRIWRRCMLAEGVEGVMRDVPGMAALFAAREKSKNKSKDKNKNNKDKGRWVLRCLNERMRFLRYGPGMFFKPHCDAHYFTRIEGKPVETFYTLHLYLNHEGLEGGATSFLSRDSKRRVDVVPQTGTVLVFQHDNLFHEGAEVKEGVKYTMRTDVMYTWEEDAE
ncbi:hypothetical protein ESCO_003441 [Escovopsis weberi]|uniref:Fe2OG dioxygenase domain-containing protein n=1 Tax=Escovopsis weberi TaxID=150374 RepID=A0A0M8N171_ESCWE|nr:hypothetical protein ESCO_003441 [Escovopsis weberi]